MAKSKFDYVEAPAKYHKCRKAAEGTAIITCMARMSYPRFFAVDKNGKYSVDLLIPPEFSIKMLKDQVGAMIEAKFGDSPPKKIYRPFKKAESREAEGYERGWHLIKAATKIAPKVLDGLADNEKIAKDDPDAVYGGRWCIATLKPFLYGPDDRKNIVGYGVTLGLNNIKLLNHDTHFGGSRTSAEAEFGDAEPEDDENDYSRTRKKKGKIFDEDDEEDRPRKKRRPVDEDEDEDEDEQPARKKRRVVEEDDEEEERPRRKKRPVDDDEDDLD